MRKLLRRLYRNPITRRIRKILFHVFNFFYVPYLYSRCHHALKNLPQGTQVFLMTRGDFGTVLVLLNYIWCWENQRGKTAVVVLTHHLDAVSQLLRIASPNTKEISAGRFGACLVKLFTNELVHFHTFSRVYARLIADYPNALYIYPQPTSPRVRAEYSPYISFFDQALCQPSENISQSFIQAYLQTRSIMDYRQEVFLDMVNLHYKTDLSKRRMPFLEGLEGLKKQLLIDRPYIVLNLSCRDYTQSHNRKKIFNPEQYSKVIDDLILEGYSVVIQGREEQPHFRKRKGLIDYAKSPYCSAKNDILLYSGCEFAIMSKSGPENFGTLCNVPILGINYVELPSMQPNLKMRFFPKHVRDIQSGRYLSWNEILKSPFYFDIGENKFSDQIEYVDIDGEEFLAAVQEFISLLAHSESWLNYTPMQVQFKKELTPLHLDLFNIKGVPCNAYLSSSKFNKVKT